MKMDESEIELLDHESQLQASALDRIAINFLSVSHDKSCIEELRSSNKCHEACLAKAKDRITQLKTKKDEIKLRNDDM